jgi:hypothetical protein
MKKAVSNSQGFGIVAALAILAITAIIALAGWAVYAHSHNTTHASVTTNTTSGQPTKTTSTTPADPYAGWKTYLDTGYSQASGISIKYPSDWQVNVGNSKTFAWTLTHSATPQGSIHERSVHLSSSTTAEQEWTNCPSADACGPSPDDTKVDGSSSTINGLDSYAVKMQAPAPTGVYHATVIKSNHPSSDGTTTFVEFWLYSDDATLLKLYQQITGTATFPT